MAGNTWANTSLLQEYRRRALTLFPELETCGHEFFAFMSLYAREIPWVQILSIGTRRLARGALQIDLAISVTSSPKAARV